MLETPETPETPDIDRIYHIRYPFAILRNPHLTHEESPLQDALLRLLHSDRCLCTVFILLGQNQKEGNERNEGNW